MVQTNHLATIEHQKGEVEEAKQLMQRNMDLYIKAESRASEAEKQRLKAEVVSKTLEETCKQLGYLGPANSSTSYDFNLVDSDFW